GYRIISARFGVPRTQVRTWVALYEKHGEKGLIPKPKGVSADPELRIKVVIGYCTGLLDAVTQTEANRMAFTSEMLGLLFAAVFGDDKSLEAMGTYIACNEASSPDHGFHVTYELYMSGLAKAFNE
ncbi:helix-turn-helix domain-containing protein, partial [Escherichia coli]|nr:helix-turn-helix domain-containing protein [Escherichia coli]